MSVSTSALIAAPVGTVWAMVSDFPNLMRWHPLLVSCTCEGEGVGAIRTVSFADYWARERLEALDPQAHTLAYHVFESDREPVIGVRGAIRLTAVSPDATRIDWTSGHAADHPHAAAVNAGLEAYYPARINHLRVALGLAAQD